MKCKKSDCFNCPYPDCINDYVAPTYKLSDEQKERFREYQRVFYQQKLEAGLCRECGKTPVVPGRTKCSACAKKDRERQRKRREAKNITPRVLMDGSFLCSRCGKSKPVEGYKLCAECLERARKSMAYARSFANRSKLKIAIDSEWKMIEARKVFNKNKQTKTKVI